MGAIPVSYTHLGEVLDVSSDIAVLDGMLSGDGLSGLSLIHISGCDAVCRAPGGRLGGIVLRISILFT